MKRASAAVLALLVSAGAQGQGFVDASVGAALRDTEGGVDDGTGTVARLEVGTQYESGLQVRAGYSYIGHEDGQQQEGRLGVFQATPRDATLGWRLGAGFVYADEDDAIGERYQRGGFVEAAAVIAASRRVTLDFAAALLKLGGPGGYDAEGAEVRAVAAFHARSMDLTVATRYATFDREHPFDEQVLELRVGAIWPWRYPEGTW